MKRSVLATCILTLSLWGWLHGCGNAGDGASDNDPFDDSNGDGDGEGGNSGTGNGDGDGEGGSTLGGFGGSPVNPGDCDPTQGICVDAGEPGFCSDGRQDPGELCDDGNTTSGDGCTEACILEADFVCPTPGEACVSTVRCGDDKITGAETCDDGNDSEGDGCSEICQTEPGWSCPIQGQRCVATACGDGILAGLEECEDGDTVPVGGDGCDTLCQIEEGGPDQNGIWQGWVCNTVGAPCTMTVCNDGVKEGSEPCDDGNQVVGDGCSPLCEVEPNCPPGGGACSSRCGDGLILPTDDEDCDDGNTADGDGCSSTCEVEPGYMCTVVQGELPASLVIPFVFRDFVLLPSSTGTVQRHPDFGPGCLNAMRLGLVDPVLDDDGKPTNSGDCNANAPPACSPNVGYINTGDGCYNRDGAGCGCRYLHANHPLASHPDDDPFKFWYRDTPGVNHTLVVPTTLTLMNGAYSFNPGGLYPVNNFGWVASGDELTMGGGNNNYGFTSEVRYWFQFQGGEQLTFAGDDDVWVFMNGRLVLDIGGVHGLTTRTVTLNANGTATCGAENCGTTATLQHNMTVGNVYEGVLFHAERQPSASNFRLGLTGFVKAESSCVSVCGDGVVTPDEECDNGAANSDTAYNGCTTTCERSAFCGDGTTNGPEQCDDGVNLSQYGGCAAGCVHGPSCGDAIVQPAFEQCDDGVFAAAYGGCAPGCILGPRCGDSITQKPPEECDDGNRLSGDGCKANCKKEEIQ